MATENPKYISVKVFGNPDSHSGAGKDGFILCNNARFEMNEPTYEGFQDNSFYFSICIESDFVVYKLIKNNVRSFNAIREGRLVFGISVPKGYAIAGGQSPYDALIEIKDKFINGYMTLKDSQKETYEYKENIMTPSMLRTITDELDGVARKYELEQKHGPYRQMAHGGKNIAYVTAEKDDIKKLMADVQYAEFVPYDEVLVAEIVRSDAPYTKLDIKIPRPKNYTIFSNGRSLGTENNVEKELHFHSGKDSECYDNEEVSFTIADLERGKPIKGVQIDAKREEIRVTLEAKPKRKKIKIDLHRIEGDNKLDFNQRPDFRLTYDSVPINIERKSGDNFFTLEGEQIKYLSRPSGFGVIFNDSNKYETKEIKLYDNALLVTYRVKEAPRPIGNTDNKKKEQETGRSVKLICENGLYEECFDQKFDAAKQQPLTVKICCGEHLLKTKVKFATEEAGLEKKGKKKDWSKVLLQTVVPLPSDWKDSLSVEITDGKTVYSTENEVWLRNGVAEVNFSLLNKKKIGIAKPIKAALIALIIGLVVGLAIGNWTGWWSGEKTDDNSAVSDTTQNETFSERENYGTSEENSSESIDVYAQLESFKTVLSSENKNLSFEEVAKLYDEYKLNAELFQQADSDFCKKIESYHKVQEAFDNSDIDQLKKCVEYGNKEMSLYNSHRLPVGTYFDVSKSKSKKEELQLREEYLINQKAQIKTFSDFNALNKGFKEKYKYLFTPPSNHKITKYQYKEFSTGDVR